MAAGRARSFRQVGNLVRSKSEGTLIDLEDDPSSSNGRKDGSASQVTQNGEWALLQPEVTRSFQTRNPFWNKLSASNPFLDEIVSGGREENGRLRTSLTPGSDNHLDANDEDAAGSSSDEGDAGGFPGKTRAVNNRSGRWRSASDILEQLERKAPRPAKVNSCAPPEPVLNPDFEWLKNDREAYKMAWLSHRQLTRSCLDLNLMSQSPGWAQTQASDFQVVCKIGHAGGAARLPDSDFKVHIPPGHLPPGEVQEVTLKVTLDPPPGLNSNHRTTVSPLLEVVLSNINTKECVSLELKLSGEVKKDPQSQTMASVVGLLSNKREGPYRRVNDCHVHQNVLRMRIQELKTHFYAIAVAEASAALPPATSVWDHLDRHVTVALYGPRYIHPSFKVVIVVCCHDDVPPKLPFSDICRGDKQLPPLVLRLWGTHRYKPRQLRDLLVASAVSDSPFQIRLEDREKRVRQSQLKIGTVLHLPVALSCGGGEMKPFTLDLRVTEWDSTPVASFQVRSPPAAPVRSDKRVCGRTGPARTSPIPEDRVPDLPKFKDAPVSVSWYGVALKSVLRQPRVEYLLEYFKGDTVALLSRETVKSVGNSKVKEWYIGFLRGRTGLVHCKNVKVITREQVIDFTGVRITTEVLLDNMTLPFMKLTYMYSAIQTLVTERISSWRGFADALGYYGATLDTITRRGAETEADKVACVLEKLKEDCHAEKSKRKFLHELLVGLLKMDCVTLVAQLIQNVVILSAAVELGVRWRELAEKVGKLNGAQMAAYEAPHRGKSGEVGPQSMWKPAYDFLFSWSQRYGDSYRDMIQDLHLALDKMKNPATRQWRQLTGALLTVNCLDVLRASAQPDT